MTVSVPGAVRSDVTANPAAAAKKTSAAWTWIIFCVLAIGVALRTWQYFADASVVLDEAAVARNVLDRHVLGLLTPLDYAQVAPPGFLLAVKACTVLFGPSEWVLRLTPFVFGLASLLVFPLVARSLLHRPAALAATFMYATAVPLIFYSAQVKQYSGDVAATLVILWLALQTLDAPILTTRRLVALIASGFGALVFSQAVVFPVTAAGVVLVADAFIRRRQDRWIRLGLASAWAVEVLAAIANGYRSMTIVDRAYMQKFWTALFMPHGWRAAGAWLIAVARATFAWRGMGGGYENLHYPFGVFVTLFLVGVAALLWSQRAKGALVVGPILLAIGAAALHTFPLATRVGLFMVPSYLLAVACGTDVLSRLILRRPVGAYGCLVLVPLATYAVLQRLPPDLSEHVRPVLRYVAAHHEADDAVWVYYGAGQAFEYYQHLMPIPGDVQIGDCDREDPRAYLREVDVERGHRRVWFVFAHFAAAFRFNERGLVLAYLDTIGRRLDEFHAPPDDQTPMVAAAYLYDLSDAGKLAHADAGTFRIRGESTPARWSCYGVASPIASRNGAAAKAVMSLVR